MMQYNVEIIQIEWLNKDNPEAEVLFTLNNKLFWAFCHPCDFEETEKAEICFHFIEENIPENTFWYENKQFKTEILTTENRLRYYCYGKIKGINPILIDCGDATFSIDDWINDERIIDHYVYFVIARLDISRYPT
jgi:hypothetical protein